VLTLRYLDIHIHFPYMDLSQSASPLFISVSRTAAVYFLPVVNVAFSSADSTRGESFVIYKLRFPCSTAMLAVNYESRLRSFPLRVLVHFVSCSVPNSQIMYVHMQGFYLGSDLFLPVSHPPPPFPCLSPSLPLPFFQFPRFQLGGLEK